MSSFNNVQLNYTDTLLYPCYSASYDGYKTLSSGKSVKCYKCNTITLGNPRRVKKGELIGYTGMTGNASGHHVHMEVKQYGQPVDPKTVFTTW